MKRFTLLFAFGLIVFVGRRSNGQSLVENYSFEEFGACPNDLAEVILAVGWLSAGSTPDYFDSCSTNFVSVPGNLMGYQMAATGNAYCGFCSYHPENYREFIRGNLLVPLTIGATYKVSYKVSSGKSQDQAVGLFSNHLDALFTNVEYTEQNPVPLLNAASIDEDSVIKDTLNWVTISGYFIADSSYTFIIIGNFYDNENTDTIRQHPVTGYAAYYYVDDVSVIKQTESGVPPMINQVQLLIFPNPLTTSTSIILTNFTRPLNIQLFDELGEEIPLQYYTTQQGSRIILTIDRGELLGGMYFLSVAAGEKRDVVKVIVE
jgi:hypothetical protein